MLKTLSRAFLALGRRSSTPTGRRPDGGSATRPARRRAPETACGTDGNGTVRRTATKPERRRRRCS